MMAGMVTAIAFAILMMAFNMSILNKSDELIKSCKLIIAENEGLKKALLETLKGGKS